MVTLTHKVVHTLVRPTASGYIIPDSLGFFSPNRQPGKYIYFITMGGGGGGVNSIKNKKHLFFTNTKRKKILLV
jgi:hypothetical protein